MVILDGNSGHVTHMFKEIRVFKTIFATADELDKCLKLIKLPILLNLCAPISELPYNRSTMVYFFSHMFSDFFLF